eukprot:UN01248
MMAVSFLQTRVEQAACVLGLLPAILLFYFYFFVANNDKERKHKSYHVSGEWGIRFLWFALAVTPVYDFTNIKEILPLENVFGVLSECYVMIHALTFVRFTLSREGFTPTVLIKMIQTRDYLIYGMIASALGVTFALTFNRFILYGGVLCGSYHIMARNWDRLRKGKSAVQGASVVPYITGALLIYQAYSYYVRKN